MMGLGLRRRVRLAQTLARLERASSGGRPRPGMWRRGFLSNRADLYPFDRWPAELFLTDVEIEGRLGGLNAPEAAALLGDKRRFHEAVRDGVLPVRTAPFVGVMEHGRWVRGTAPAGPDMIAKPAEGSRGRGVQRIGRLEDVPRDGVTLVEGRVEAHPALRAIFPEALNTARILVGRAGNGAAPVLLGAAQRFGTRRSAPTDNFSAGGVVAGVDGVTGVLTEAVGLMGGAGRRAFPVHPETGVPMAGVVVPFWAGAVAMALAATAAVPGLRYVGWDVAIAPDGPVVVEGNAWLPNPNIIQIHRPLLLDAVARDYFVEVGVIGRARARRAARAAGA